MTDEILRVYTTAAQSRTTSFDIVQSSAVPLDFGTNIEAVTTGIAVAIA